MIKKGQNKVGLMGLPGLLEVENYTQLPKPITSFNPVLIRFL